VTYVQGFLVHTMHDFGHSAIVYAIDAHEFDDICAAESMLGRSMISKALQFGAAGSCWQTLRIHIGISRTSSSIRFVAAPFALACCGLAYGTASATCEQIDIPILDYPQVNIHKCEMFIADMFRISGRMFHGSRLDDGHKMLNNLKAWAHFSRALVFRGGPFG